MQTATGPDAAVCAHGKVRAVRLGSTRSVGRSREVHAPCSDRSLCVTTEYSYLDSCHREPKAAAQVVRLDITPKTNAVHENFYL